MVSLLVTSIELKEISDVLKCEPVYQGLYYYKQRPLEMFSLNDLVVAVLTYSGEREITDSSVIDYKFNWPAWKSSVPDLVKHCAAR